MIATAPSQALWSGRAMRDAFAFATTWLQHHRDRVNALNVFPVPDGDTGTNMSLTMSGAMEAIDDLPADASASDVAQRLAYGALMGARGNSGVILSQVFRGFANGIGDASQIDGRDFARALEGARETAYKAVMRPVEGTMLTVVRAAAEAARTASVTEPGITDVLDAALHGARIALERTPEQLDILRQAGVVDAGGGVVYILKECSKSATGDTELPSSAAIDGDIGDMAFLDEVEDLTAKTPSGTAPTSGVRRRHRPRARARDNRGDGPIGRHCRHRHNAEGAHPRPQPRARCWPTPSRSATSTRSRSTT